MAEVEKTRNSRNLEKGEILKRETEMKNERLGKITHSRKQTEKQ